MQTIQKQNLLLMALVFTCTLSGCLDDKDKVVPESITKPQTVSDFMHDIDAARAVAKAAQIDLSKQNDMESKNASQALALLWSPETKVCWSKHTASTATTDHGCLDAKGFVRGK